MADEAAAVDHLTFLRRGALRRVRLPRARVCMCSHASDAFDHHAVHVAEERGIRLALVGFACAVVGEIASNNRVGRALSALTHHRKQD